MFVGIEVVRSGASDRRVTPAIARMLCQSDQSGHVEQPACRTRCLKEPHAQRSWHLQRSPPAQSDLPPGVVGRVSPKTRGSPNAVQSRVLLDAKRAVAV